MAQGSQQPGQRSAQTHQHAVQTPTLENQCQRHRLHQHYRRTPGKLWQPQLQGLVRRADSRYHFHAKQQTADRSPYLLTHKKGRNPKGKRKSTSSCRTTTWPSRKRTKTKSSQSKRRTKRPSLSAKTNTGFSQKSLRKTNQMKTQTTT